MASLLTLPVHLVYQILDDLQPKDIFLSAYNCRRLIELNHTSISGKEKIFPIVYDFFLFDVSFTLTEHRHRFILFVFALKILYLHSSVFIQQ